MADFLVKRDALGETRWQEAEQTPLGEGEARLRVDAFALTANNVTYAAFGEAMRYWDFFPAAEAGWGRVPVWGFATVAESRASGVETGVKVYGYLPISEHFTVKPGRISASSFMDIAPHRQGLAPIYNTYVFTGADPTYEPAHEAQQMLFRPLFTTGWMIDDCLIEAGEAVPETVVVSSASCKTALALAHCLKARPGVETVALTSPGNRDYVAGTGLYSRVATYDDVPRLETRGLTAFVDFLGRITLTADVHHALKDRLIRSLIIGATDWQADRAPVDLPPPQPQLFFVPTYAAERAKALGPEVLDKRLNAALKDFYTASGQYIEPVRRQGRDAINQSWAETLNGQRPAREGLILAY